METSVLVSILLDIVIRLIGLEGAKAQLSQKEAELANLSADAVERARFGKTSER